MSSLLPLLEVETEKLNEAGRELDTAIDTALSLEPATQPQDSDSIDSDSESDFDISWRPDDYDSPEVMDRLLDIDRSDLVTETLRAATLGHSKTLESLLTRPQWVELLSAVDNDGNTALQIAESRGHEDIVQKILCKQADSPRLETTASHAARRPDSPILETTASHPDPARRPDSPRLETTASHAPRRPDSPRLETTASHAPRRPNSPRLETTASHAPRRPDSPTLDHVVVQSTDVRALRRMIECAEDFACVLQNLRDEEPRDAQQTLIDITSAIGELYRLSSVLRELYIAFDAPQYVDRLYRIMTDAALVVNSARLTLNGALSMVGRASPATNWMVWADLSHKLQNVERVPLLMRLKWYHSLTQGLLDVLEGYPFNDALLRIKSSIQRLLQQQQPESLRHGRPVTSHRIIESSEL
jgi:hypothetical protein